VEGVVPQIVLTAGGPRSILLIIQAYKEEGIECPDIDERQAPTKLLYPRSFVDAVSKMPGDKRHDYCFIGGLYRPDTYQNRKWIINFATQRFNGLSYFLVTDGGAEHPRLGSFDYTNIERDIFVPKQVPRTDRAFFHDHFFRKLRCSKFTLCPAGDAPWSMRFFEAIMCRSIPIVSDLKHVGRNELERSIGYRVYLREEEHIYDEHLVEENFRTFIRHQTLIEGDRSRNQLT
jgi:Exostosin family